MTKISVYFPVLVSM